MEQFDWNAIETTTTIKMYFPIFSCQENIGKCILMVVYASFRRFGSDGAWGPASRRTGAASPAKPGCHFRRPPRGPAKARCNPAGSPKRQPVASGQQPVVKGKKQPVALKGKRKAACTAALSAKRRVQKRCNKRKPAACGAEDASRLVGDARETEAEHRARHPRGKGWEKVCVGMSHWDSWGEIGFRDYPTPPSFEIINFVDFSFLDSVTTPPHLKL